MQGLQTADRTKSAAELATSLFLSNLGVVKADACNDSVEFSLQNSADFRPASMTGQRFSNDCYQVVTQYLLTGY